MFVDSNTVLKMKFQRLHTKVIDISAARIIDFLFQERVLGDEDMYMSVIYSLTVTKIESYNYLFYLAITTTTATTILRFSGLCMGQTRWAGTGTRRNIHPFTPIMVSIISYLLPPYLWSMASSLFNFRAWQSFSTISLQVFFGLALGLAPSTSYSIHFFTQSLSSFRNTCTYHRNLFCCSTEIMSSNPSLSRLVAEMI